MNYGFAVLSVAAAFACISLLHHFLNAVPPVSLFLCAVIFVAWFAGLGPALLATALSVLAFGYFFLLPINMHTLVSSDLPRIILFGIAALIVASVSAAQRSTTASLQRVRDQLQDAVEDLETVNGQLRLENAERTAAEQKTREAERELQSTIDMIPALVARYRPDGSIDFVNQTWQTYTGLSRESVRGRSRSVIIHPDDLAPFESAWRAHLVTGEPLEVEQRVRRADGRYRWHLVRRAPLRDEKGEVLKWYGVAFDIHNQKQAEGALRKSEAYLAQAQQLSHTGSFGWNVASGDIVWSKETYQILGIDRAVKPTIGLIMQHVPPEDYEFVRAEIDRGAEGAPNLEFEHRWLTPDGDLKQVYVRAHRVNYESGEEEIVGALMDVTETRKSQKALSDAQAQLAHANRVATLGEMSASIAHEVNQPLTAIVGNGWAGVRWLTRDTPDIGEAVGALRQIIEEAERAGGVIRRIRALSRKGKPEMWPLDINTLIDEVLALVRSQAVTHRVSLRLQNAPQLPPVHGDRIQLQQVIINLVVNGIQAMASVADRPRVLVIRTLLYEADTILVAVEDSGAGVGSEDLDQLFNPFYTTKPDGMGMGLSISRTIIEAHGGRVWATRNSGPGMTFQLTISTRLPSEPGARPS